MLRDFTLEHSSQEDNGATSSRHSGKEKSETEILYQQVYCRNYIVAHTFRTFVLEDKCKDNSVERECKWKEEGRGWKGE